MILLAKWPRSVLVGDGTASDKHTMLFQGHCLSCVRMIGPSDAQARRNSTVLPQQVQACGSSMNSDVVAASDK